VKVKVGREDDALRLAEIASVLKDVPLRLDANEAWGVEEAIEKIRSFKGISIASVEQPVAAADWAGLREIRSGTGVPIMADESLITLGDAMNLADQGAADVFHIRLGKLGGLLGAQRVVELAQQRGIGLHLGTMVGESGILTRASEVFGRLYQGFDCFDGKGQNRLLLSEDLLADPRQAEEAGLDVPGLGSQARQP
jgi:L-alanine-DL-glutamate epimerase-like enolase superfamily enzyme